MVNAITAIPLLLTLALSLGGGFYVMKRKLLAQSICVRQVSRLQEELREPLRKLLKLNPQATRLRAQRQQADYNLEVATASGYPPAIAAAEARQAAVILEQEALHARQLALLMEAGRIRIRNRRDLRDRLDYFPAWRFHSRRYFLRSLAVEPKPAFDLSPNYEPVDGFPYFQQQRYDYQIDLLGIFAGRFPFKLDSVQKIACSVSLEEGGEDWTLRVLAAKAP
jgi:hypothetical protein